MTGNKSMQHVASMLRGVRRRLGGRSANPTELKVLSDEERAAIPDTDFVSASFDEQATHPTANMVVIFSTPRSGSTLLCQLIHRAGLCTPHEYFQPDHYLPLLASRWECAEGRRVNWRRYASALERYRTSARGVLGINLHGSHLRRFQEALPHFSVRKVKYVWLQRRDKLRQAVSFGIAKQTGQWSSEFETPTEPNYEFSFFNDRLRMIQRQEALIQAFATLRSIVPELIYYEDFTGDPQSILGPIFEADFSQIPVTDGRMLRRQRNSTSEEFLKRFAADFFARRSA